MRPINLWGPDRLNNLNTLKFAHEGHLLVQGSVCNCNELDGIQGDAEVAPEGLVGGEDWGPPGESMGRG